MSESPTTVVPGQPAVQPQPKLPDPVYPKQELPEKPEVPHNKEDTPQIDCHGSIEEPLDVANSPVPPPPEGVGRILIGIPMLTATQEFLNSWVRLWTELILSGEKRYQVAYSFIYRKPVHMAEESLVEIARYNKATHLLLMDDDIYDVTKADIDKLFEADKDVIGGVMHASKFPHAMCVFRRYNKDLKVMDMPSDTSIFRLYEVPCLCPSCKAPQGFWDAKFCTGCGGPLDNLVQQADLIPFALTMFKMSTFDKLKEPYFHCTNKYPTDSWFADRLIEAGLTEHAHMGVRLNHAGITDETKQFYIQMGMAAARKKGAVVELSPQQMEQHQYLLHNKMKEVEDGQKTKPVVAFAGAAVANKEQPNDMTLKTHG